MLDDALRMTIPFKFLNSKNINRKHNTVKTYNVNINLNILLAGILGNVRVL